MGAQSPSQLAELISSILLEYAQSAPQALPLNPSLSIKNDLAIESVSLVSIMLRLGDELGVDVVEAGLDLGTLVTVGDVVALASRLQSLSNTRSAV